MNITHESVNQSSGQIRSTISQKNRYKCKTKEYNYESISQVYTTKTANLNS